MDNDSRAYLREVIEAHQPYVQMVMAFRFAGLFTRLWWAVIGDIPLKK